MNKGRRIGRMALCLIVSFVMIMTLIPRLPASLAYAGTGDEPAHTKTLTDNHDGTYTLSLDVVGDSEKKPNNVNVVVIFDTSGSMNSTRMSAAKTAVNNLADKLYAYNTTSNPDTVEMALVDFSTHASTAQAPTNSSTTFKRAVNNLSAGGGTNWEAALKQANNVNFGDTDQTFIIFVSDGNPTFRDTKGTTRITDNRWYNNDDIYYSEDGVYGLGSDNPQNSNYSPQSMTYCYNHAVDDATTLVTKVGADHFFAIGAFGNAARMQDLTDDAGSDSDTNYYRADDTAALNTAISDILAKIEMAGIADASLEDGTTNQVTTSSGDIAELLEVDTSSFKYYKGGQEWADAPAAEFKNGTVEWDLESAGVLENGVRYTVTFDCYPSQDTYDIIAKLKNGDITYASLDSEIKKYIVDNGGGSYSLRTNTNATLSYDDTRDDAGQQTKPYTNPDPVGTDAATMSVKKTWENELDARAVGSINMTVLMDNKEFHDVTLSADDTPAWTKEGIFISPGIIKNGKVLKGAEGHDFTFKELGSEQYNWELVAPTVHPMLIDGTLTMLTMVDEAHTAPSGAQTYTINGKTYYSNGSSAASLDAYNYRRSNLNLTKVVTGEDAPKDATFPFTLTVNNSKASTGSSSDTSSDYYVWFSIYDTNAGATVKDATVTGATAEAGNTGYYYAPSGTAITVQMKAGWNLRFTNLPTETTYTFAEGTMPTGFAFNKAELTAGTDTTFKGAQTSTGTIEATNTSYTVTYTNDYQLTDLEITKEWSDADNQDGKRLTADELKAKLTLSPAVEGKEPTVVDNEDGTYTITYTGLPRFNNGTEVEYTVAESAIDGYTTTGSPAKDHGTITNTHEPETIDVKVTKVWDDSNDIGKIRPTSINAQLKADGEVSGDPVALNEGNEWTYTWEDLPKYKDGEEIVYTADETAVPSGYDKTGPEKTTAEDGTITFTVTNTYNPTPVKVDPPVQKVITGNEELYNGGDFTFTIAAVTEGAPTPANTQITNSAAYELDNKPGYYEFGEITFTQPGEYTYKITESGEVDGVTNDKDAAAGKTITFTVEDDGEGNLTVSPTTDQVQLAFTNVYDANGEATLVVSKELAGAAWPAGKSLTFTVEGKDNAPMPEETTATLTSAGNVSFGPIAYGLSDAGKTYEYTITESSFGKGWTGAPESITAKVAVADKGDGTLETTVTYTPDTAKFTNTYKASGKATIEATKALEGAAWPAGKSLTFTLAGTDSAPMPAQGGETVTLTEAGKATFGEIAYTEADAGKTYTYTISEGDGFGRAWTGSGDITATVKVTDNGDGTLATEVTYDPTSDTITNTYKAEGTTEIKVTKKLAGTVWPEGKTLTFTLTGTGDAPMPETTTATLTAAGDVTFGPIALDEADAGKTYTYTVSEGTGFGGAWTGSGDVTATVVVTDDGAGKVTGAVTYSPENATITNTYKATGKVELEATKAIAGAAWPEGKSITFTLAGEGGTLPETKTVTLTEAGKATFGAINYTEADIDKTYTYTISEDGFGDGWTGSGDITATVKVTDNGDGTLKTEVTYSPEDKTITNTYAATGSATLKASKLLQGRAWMEGESFTFTLKDPNGTVVDEQTVTADGEVTFKTINYNEADAGKTYTYTIEETGNNSANVTPSGTVEAAVTITDNGDGSLATAVEYSPENATIINTYEPTPVNAQINVHKTIEGFLEGQPDTTFEFTLYDEDGVQVGEPITITTENGEGSASFEAITYYAVGEYNYTVKEVEGDEAGYTYSTETYPVTVTVTDDPVNGKLLADVSYGEADESGEAPTAVDVVNQFDMTDVDVTLTLTKTIDDQSNSAPDGTFKFKLYKDSVSEDNFVEEKSITTENLTGSVDFTELTFDKSGEYTYVVVEEAGDVNGFTYDTTEHTYKIVIDDNFDAAILEVDEEGSTLDATITNVYKATATSTVLKVKKEIEDTSGSAYETEFTFTLAGAEGAPMPAEGGETVTVTGAQEGEFGSIAYEKAGTFEYTITEVAGDAAGYQYDSTEYKVNVTVEDQNGQLVATAAYIDKEGKSQTDLTVTNTYDPEDAKITITANKTVEDKTGGAAGNPKTFTFELLDADGNVVETVSRQGGGTVTFSELTYSKVGEYNYTIREVAGSDAGYTYDTNEYGVTVTVTDPDQDGILKAAITAGDSVEFVNPYEAKPCGTEIELTKKLTGRDLADGEFNFTLVDITGGGSEEIETVSNNEKGNISFDYIEYTMPGTYVYEVYEAVPDETNGVEYDQSIEVVTVKVVDDGNGQLSLTVTYGGDKTFENTYNAEGSFTPEVTKRLEGKDLKDGQFTFTMVGPDGQTYTAKNDAEGKVVFEALDFDLNDAGQTYEYTITEVNDGQANIKYDEHAETLTVTIKDNGDGTLQISDEYSGKATFTNKYEEPPAPPTGDTTVVVPYIVIGVAALILLLMLLFRTRKNRA